jgi:serine/threonine-protein kinase HipA
VPADIKQRILTTAINENDSTASLTLAMSVALYFELDAAKAREIAKQVGKAVSKRHNEAALHGIGKNEIDRMASAFEADSKEALSGESRRKPRFVTLKTL